MWLRNRVSLFFLDKYNIYLYLDNIKWQVFFFGQDETPRESRLGLLPDCHLKVVLTQNSHFKSSNSKLTGRLARGIWYFRSQPTLTSRPKKKTCHMVLQFEHFSMILMIFLVKSLGFLDFVTIFAEPYLHQYLFDFIFLDVLKGYNPDSFISGYISTKIDLVSLFQYP